MAVSEAANANSEAFKPYLIYEGRRWKLYLNARDQAYLGRSYAWLGRRVRNMALDELAPHERVELFDLMGRYRRALWKLRWNPIRVNACWLGNEVQTHEGHGHMHLIPRYDDAP